MKIERSGLLILGTVAGLFLAPTVGQTCPKCFASSDTSVLHAYYISILFMTLIPFGIVGSILAWVFFRMRGTSRDAS